jgi:hypothetical protein
VPSECGAARHGDALTLAAMSYQPPLG